MAFTIVKKFISKKWTEILLNRIALKASRSGEINVHISYDNKKVTEPLKFCVNYNFDVKNRCICKKYSPSNPFHRIEPQVGLYTVQAEQRILMAISMSICFFNQIIKMVLLELTDLEAAPSFKFKNRMDEYG